MSDYELLRSDAGAFTGATGVVWVSGPDTVSFLDGLLSQNVEAMAPGSVAPSLLLAPNGKLRATLWLLRDERRLGLVCDAARTGLVATDLTRFKIRVDATISVEKRQVWDVWGPRSPHLLPQAPHPGSWIEDETLTARLSFRHSELPRFVVVGEQPPVKMISGSAAAVVRIEVGEPVMGVDLTDSTIPQEGVDVTTAVDFDKGCYLGQELVARIDSRGHVNRRLIGVVFDGMEVPPSGGEIFHEDQPVGVLSSVGFSIGLDAPIALGMIRIEVADGARVAVAGRAGSVATLPLQA
ncbi:MAG: glycine cleavage T C-terminal barrel domain-containing protein [Actinomycetota bacterium]|nr:glycine cleavage T C-terminal barrel domain-containing protein [Actinomycetota bacterium]